MGMIEKLKNVALDLWSRYRSEVVVFGAGVLTGAFVF